MILEKVKALVERRRLLTAGDRVVVACSGGPDSLALVHLLHRLQPAYGFDMVVAHVDHMLRGAESAREAEFVRAFCRRLGLDCQVAAIDVPGVLAERGGSTQEVARTLRYAFLRRVADSLGGAKIATGHHRDDQAETVLINFLRGAGPGGLRGMQPAAGGIIRPLLSVTRQEIEDYCAAEGLTPCLDSSNLHTDYLRNRVRLELLPLLAREYNPAIGENLARLAEIMADQYDFLKQCAADVYTRVADETEGRLALDSAALAALPTALRREVLRLAIEKKRGSLTGISFWHVEKLLEMALDGKVGSLFTLPGGLSFVRTYDGLATVDRAGSARAAVGIAPPGRALVVPGVTEVPELNLAVAAALHDEIPAATGRLTAVFDWQALSPPLVVRTRVAGDRFWPAGMQGSKKLKEFFIDAKVPRSERDRVPLICDQDGILWVAGYRQSARGRPDSATRRVLELTLIRQEEITC
ncbi:tRNA(Ile)-lysidine synthetase [Thermosinus carboxydivorans Nor1]|uniref:tRNA(Ile)-lysidine synthase n=1 Tax=Thermosinus carboxydivorans Nor1 TaxID=401526 RepID=A1HRS0_9FIRM|nr:tRNA lysidine(34) synthetase TilS [Thermosinus carboxydivorans]EAX47241.1 tRNA(Ile)-lysidine synthetase [Thermosinus carboxydivorans Nor1]